MFALKLQRINIECPILTHDNANAKFSISRDKKEYSVEVNASTKAYPLVPLSARSTWAKDSSFKIRKEKDSLHNFHSISWDEKDYSVEVNVLTKAYPLVPLSADLLGP